MQLNFYPLINPFGSLIPFFLNFCAKVGTRPVVAINVPKDLTLFIYTFFFVLDKYLARETVVPSIPVTSVTAVIFLVPSPRRDNWTIN
jgi:hypothetical protein